MKYQLVRYEGVDERTQNALKETVVKESSDPFALYDERDVLDKNPISLRAVRHGVRPKEQAKAARV